MAISSAAGSDCLMAAWRAARVLQYTSCKPHSDLLNGVGTHCSRQALLAIHDALLRQVLDVGSDKRPHSRRIAFPLETHTTVSAKQRSFSLSHLALESRAVYDDTFCRHVEADAVTTAVAGKATRSEAKQQQ